MCLNAGRLWPSGRAIRLLWQSAFPRQKRRLWNGSASANTPGFVFLFFFFFSAARAWTDKRSPRCPLHRGGGRRCVQIYTPICSSKNKRAAFLFFPPLDSKLLYFWKELLRFLCKYQIYIAATRAAPTRVWFCSDCFILSEICAMRLCLSVHVSVIVLGYNIWKQWGQKHDTAVR